MSVQLIQNKPSVARLWQRAFIFFIICAMSPFAFAQTAPVFTSPAPADGTVGVGYSHTFEASGSAPITFSLTGGLPPGLTFNRMLAARVHHTATRLNDGRVLVAAGVVNVSSGGFFNSAELFDPATNTWRAAGSLAVSRGFHTATLLADGKVLVTGGLGANPPSPAPGRLASAELYDPATNTWSAVGSLAEARAHHTATLLANGKVLVAGGSSNNSNLPVNSAELFDPATNTWSAAGGFVVERRDHKATLLPNGRVLIAGGGNNVSGSLANADLYDPATDTWTAAASLARARNYPSLTLFNNGTVLAVGGFDQLGIGIVASAELYDPATNIWSAAGSLSVGRYDHTATQLSTGQVLVAGGFGSNFLASAELYDPVLNSWTTTGSLATARQFHTATMLTNGNVLAAGGLGTGNANINRAEFYDIVTNTWQMPGVIFGTPTSAGTYNFSVQAANGTLPSATQNVSLLISAPTSVFSPSATTITFLAQTVATTSFPRTLTIINTGTAALTIGSPAVTGPFAISANNCVSIAPAGTCAITVTFTPTVVGVANGMLTIPSNALGSPHGIVLSGNGSTPPGVGPYAYITNQNSNNVSVIDTFNNTVVATIPVGSQPYGVAVNPLGSRVYVTNQLSNSVSVINVADNTLVTTVSVGTYPNGVTVNPAGTRVYVANSSNSVSVIHTTTNTVIATVPAGITPVAIAVNPAGTRIYVVNNNGNNVSVIDTSTNTVIATVTGVGAGPQGIAINPAGTRVYVPHTSPNKVAVIDTATNTVIDDVLVGGSPLGVTVNADGTRVYVTNSSSNSVSVIDTTTSPNTVVATVAVGRLPIGIAVNPAGTRLYVANRLDNNVSVIDTSNNTVLSAVTVGSRPNGFGQFIGLPPVAPPLTLIGVQSRKDHGPAGTHNLTLDANVPITGAVTVEPRVIGAGHSIVFVFSESVTTVGSATAINGAAQAVAANVSTSGSEVTVTLPGVPDNSRALITLTGVNGNGGGNVGGSTAVGFLVGDVNNSRSVNSADISGVKARSGQVTTASNFKFDLNATGTINSSDISAVKARSGLTLP